MCNFLNFLMLNKKWLVLLILSIISMFTILFLAYFRMIPGFIVYIPYYDKIGHLTLYGLFGFVIHRATNRKTKWGLPLGLSAFIVFTVVEEYLQYYSPNRTASWADLVLSITGILLAYFLDRKFLKK